MIHIYGSPDAPVARLMTSLEGRGHTVQTGEPPVKSEGTTLVLGPGLDVDPMALGVLLGAWRAAPGARVLVVSLLGAHPDARAARLKALWQTEELVRGSGIPSLALRLAPLVGPTSPLWAKLAGRPRLPRGGRDVVQPVVEEDVIESIDRALNGRVPWSGWYELAGPEAFSLRELSDMAAAGGALPDGGAWEPPHSEMREHRLAETILWQADFGITHGNVRELAGSWAA